MYSTIPPFFGDLKWKQYSPIVEARLSITDGYSLKWKWENEKSPVDKGVNDVFDNTWNNIDESLEESLEYLLPRRRFARLGLS
jgi:hypothetical protein